MKLKSKEIKVANYISWARESKGYLKPCKNCGSTIYLHCDSDGVWKPYESWIAGNAQPGEFILHNCPSAKRDSQKLNLMNKNELIELEKLIRRENQKILKQIPDKVEKLKRKKKK